jgi:hypothetical protein
LDINVSDALGKFGMIGWKPWTAEEQPAIAFAQNFVLLVFVWYLACVSPSFLHRTSSLIEFPPFKNRIWVFGFVLSMILQLAFTAVSLKDNPIELSKIPWFIYSIGFGWPIVLIPAQELVKMHDNKEFTRFQKRSKLEFSTKVRNYIYKKRVVLIFVYLAWNALTIIMLNTIPLFFIKNTAL